MQKECPMCGEFMRLVERETVSRVRDGTGSQDSVARVDLSGV